MKRDYTPDKEGCGTIADCKESICSMSNKVRRRREKWDGAIRCPYRWMPTTCERGL